MENNREGCVVLLHGRTESPDVLTFDVLKNYHG